MDSYLLNYIFGFLKLCSYCHTYQYNNEITCCICKKFHCNGCLDKFQKIYSCDINQNFINDAWDYIKKDDVNAGSNIEISYMDGASHLEHLYKNKKIDNKNFILFSDGHEKGQTSELDELEVMIKFNFE